MPHATDYRSAAAISPADRYRWPLHWLAVLTALATFPLVWMGGLVTSHGAGMSVPDWPNSFGYNMFALPWSRFLGAYAGGVFYEHTHRLLGSLLGVLAIALTATAWATGARRYVKWLATGVLLAVIAQGVMGGLRVTEVSPALALAHGIFGQAVFCLTALTAVVTSRWWAARAQMPTATGSASGVTRVALAVVVLLSVQLTLGAMMRHDPSRSPVAMTGAGLAIPDVPLSYGRLLPPVSAEGMARANAVRTFDLHMPPVERWQVWLHFAHRLGAVAVTAGVLTLGVVAWRRARSGGEPVTGVLAPALLLPALIAGQVTLGVLTVLWRKPADVATAHQALGAVTLVTAAITLATAWRAFGIGRAATTSDEFAPRATGRPHSGDPCLPASPEHGSSEYGRPVARAVPLAGHH